MYNKIVLLGILVMSLMVTGCLQPDNPGIEPEENHGSKETWLYLAKLAKKRGNMEAYKEALDRAGELERLNKNFENS